ncbi:MAG: PIN domain-containing protein [Deferrisoma sp.]
MRPVLIDTSVWIWFLRKNGPAEIQRAVQDVLLEGRARTCWVVRAELLVGARDEEGWSRLWRGFSALPSVVLDDAVWEDASRLGFKVRRKGLTVPLPDLLVAQAAIAGGCELWHSDHHFERLKQYTDLHTRSFVGGRA